MAKLAPPETLKRRAEFLRLARCTKLARPGFVMQFRLTGSAAPLRIGYTATKKLGNAVVRNRSRRRLREAARLSIGARAPAGVELVLVCRQDTATLPFAALCGGLAAAFAELAP